MPKSGQTEEPPTEPDLGVAADFATLPRSLGNIANLAEIDPVDIDFFSEREAHTRAPLLKQAPTQPETVLFAVAEVKSGRINVAGILKWLGWLDIARGSILRGVTDVELRRVYLNCTSHDDTETGETFRTAIHVDGRLRLPPSVWPILGNPPQVAVVGIKLDPKTPRSTAPRYATQMCIVAAAEAIDNELTSQYLLM